jgi:hypothetical protein
MNKDIMQSVYLLKIENQMKIARKMLINKGSKSSNFDNTMGNQKCKIYPELVK